MYMFGFFFVSLEHIVNSLLIEAVGAGTGRLAKKMEREQNLGVLSWRKGRAGQGKTRSKYAKC